MSFKIFPFLITLFFIVYFVPEEPVEPGKAYISSYFKDNTSGMFLAVSYDGYTWETMNDNRPFVEPELGTHMRDPSILLGPDGKWHGVFGTQQGLGGKTIGYMWSDDLITWHGQKEYNIEKGPLAGGVINAWAPELFYNEKDDLFYIIWTSSTKRIPGLQSYLKGNQRSWYITTKDFETFTDPELVLNPQPNAWIIDADFFWVEDQQKYFSFYKVESDDTLTGKKTGIHFSVADQIQGPWGEIVPDKSETIYPDADGNDEGPSPLKIGEYYAVYFDRGLIRSKDLKNWENASHLVTWPKDFKHGTFIQVDRKWADCLVEMSCN
ncbi:MAG: family 43 glycosylhydrolase [Balneolales bacterium]|nr:family 43 glycosylhydrolase [Balneolales bacterium]